MTFCDFCKGRKEVLQTEPGLYNIPSQFGSGPKYSFKGRPRDRQPDYAPSYKAIPSTLNKNGVSLGKKKPSVIREKQEEVPGPNFNTTTIGTGRKSSIKKRVPIKENDNPGPGAYSPEENNKKNGPSYSIGIGRRYNFVQDNVLVAPGSYDIPSTLQSRPYTSFGKRPSGKEKRMKRQHPGPIYDVSKPIGSDARKSAFPKATEIPIKQTPGPGDYDIESDFGRGSRIKTAMHVRGREPEFPKTNAPYYDIGTTIKPKSRSIAHRPETSYETISPGPVYDIGTTVTPRPVSIGNKREYKDPHAFVPSPDTYFQTQSQTRARDVVLPLSGSGERDIINFKEEEAKPGPASYRPITPTMGTGRGSTIKHRTYDDVRPDTAAPYHAATSSLGGPMYTIGLRDV